MQYIGGFRLFVFRGNELYFEKMVGFSRKWLDFCVETVGFCEIFGFQDIILEETLFSRRQLIYFILQFRFVSE